MLVKTYGESAMSKERVLNERQILIGEVPHDVGMAIGSLSKKVL